jgi:hypothetical protein
MGLPIVHERKDLFEKLKSLEFSKPDPYDYENRLPNSFSDEFIIRKAKIYQIMGESDRGYNDNRLQVQPLPEFFGLAEEELDNLPIYPMFNKGTMITGTSIKEDKKKADYVMCICNRDFSIGYVLGLANDAGSGLKDEKFKDSYGYNNVKTFLAQRRVLPDNFDYKNLIVTTFFESDQGGMINCYNRKTGDWVLLNSAGAILTVQQENIFMRVGSPANPPASGPVGFSMIHMTSDKILIKSPNVEIDANDLVLGKHNLTLCGTLTQGPIIGRNGVPSIPIDNIHV